MIDIIRRSLLIAAGLVAARPLLRIAVAADVDPTAALSYPYAVPPLGYDYAANEPAIDTMTMQLHHDKHHAAYVNNLNAALKDNPSWQSRPLADLLAHLDDAPEAIRRTLRNNAGGHANHTMFWQILGGKGGEPDGELKEAIDRDLGGFDKMKADVSRNALGVFGSGWSMIVSSPDGKLSLETRPNQDSPWTEGKAPLLGNDVWEHAYYLKYENRRADYVSAWWSVVNWRAVAARYAAAKAGTLAI